MRDGQAGQGHPPWPGRGGGQVRGSKGGCSPWFRVKGFRERERDTYKYIYIYTRVLSGFCVFLCNSP